MDDLLKVMGVNMNGLRYDELNDAERKTLNDWLNALQKNELTVDKIKEFVHSLRDAIEQEFTRTDLSEKQEIFVKARLRNILMLDNFLLAPDRAKKALEQATKGVK